MQLLEKTNRKNIALNSKIITDFSLFEDNFKNEKQKLQVMLMSDCEDIKKLNYYIFSSTEDIDFYNLDDLPNDPVDLFSQMDILIYNKSDKKLKQEILNMIKENSLQLKFFYITNKPYLRQKDSIIEHMSGVDKLFKKDFFLEDYILSIEKYTKTNFYSKRLLDLTPKDEIITYNKKEYEDTIKDLLLAKVFFSTFTYEYESDIEIDSYNIKKIVREYDTIFIDKEKKEINFLFLSLIPEFGREIISKRMKNFSITLKEIKSSCSFDIVFNL